MFKLVRSRRFVPVLLAAIVGTLAGAGALLATDLAGPRGFTAIVPCRMVDTRPTSTLTGVWGPPSIAGGASRTITVDGALAVGNPCANAIPTGVSALAVNVTVANVTAPGDLRSGPGVAVPTSSIINFKAGVPLANAVIMSVGSDEVTIKNGGASGQTDVLFDVFGFYTDVQNIGTTGFSVHTSVTGLQPTDVGGAGTFFNDDGACTSTDYSSCGLYALTYTSAPNSSAITGLAYDGGAGVYGEYFDPALNDPGNTQAGVVASSDNGRGLVSYSSAAEAIEGYSTAHDGIHGFTSASGRSGVYGEANASDGSGNATGFSVYGYNDFNTSRGFLGGYTAGFFGAVPVGAWGSDGTFASLTPDVFVTGVWGESIPGVGVVGSSDSGFAAILGWSGCTSCGTPALDAFGDFQASGTKAFVEPHPTDPTKEIKYVSLEGPESGTYFRGSGQIVNGFATIQVPETFRDVSDSDGLTAVVSPVGQMATLAVISQDLNKVVIQGSADVKFNYIVNGVRRAYKNFNPVAANTTFVPRSPNDKLWSGPTFAPEIVNRLKSNGILNADGSVNVETAKKLGWDQTAQWASAVNFVKNPPKPPKAPVPPTHHDSKHAAPVQGSGQ